MLQQWRRITVLEKAGQVTFKPCLEGHRHIEGHRRWEQAKESVLNRKIRFFLITCNVECRCLHRSEEDIGSPAAAV